MFCEKGMSDRIELLGETGRRARAPDATQSAEHKRTRAADFMRDCVTPGGK
jgi:hypothetical protein